MVLSIRHVPGKQNLIADSLPLSGSIKYGVGALPSFVSGDHPSSQIRYLCFSNSGSECPVSRCHDNVLERGVFLHVPCVQVRSGFLQDHSYCSSWPRQSWFPDLLQLCCVPHLKPPLRPDFFLRPKAENFTKVW